MPQEHPSCPRTWRPRTNELDAGVCRAGWYSRRARASAERGRVQGPGHAEADLGPRTVTGTVFRAAIPGRLDASFAELFGGLLSTRIGTPTTTLIPTLMGTRIPTLMGTQATRVAGLPASRLFQQVRTLAGRGHGQKPPVTLPRYAT